VTITNLSSNVTDQDFGFYEAIDYGDLPDSYYDTLVASQGAGHIVGSLRLGATVTTEANGQPSTEANLDTDDGITFVTAAWTPGTTVELTANVVGSNGYLVGWFDWDGDGAFGAGEMVDFSEMTSGDNTIYVDIPAGADTSSGYVYMRFRLYDRTTMSTISPNGLATNGEVEDYRRSISPTAVELAGFWATAQDGAVLLTWETATELDNLGFNLYRAESPTGPRVRLNSELIPSQVPGSPLGAIYERLDGDVRAGIGYYYWLEAVDVYGHTMLYGPVSASLAPGSYGNRVFLPLIGK
jgi:hypothetical protein